MALGDHIKNVIYGTIATTLSAGVIAVILWLKGLPLHWALLVTAGFALAVAIASYLIILVIEKLRKPSIATTALKEPNKDAPVPADQKAKLTFEIDEKNSQVRVDNGRSEVRRIFADIKLRCFKATDSAMAVRSFHISLNRAWPLGDEATVIRQEDWRAIWQYPGMQTVNADEPWTIREPSTDYRIYHFSLDITPSIHVGLSPDHFLRVTMDAVGQEPVSQPVYVYDWAVPNGGLSAISLTPPEEFPLEAQKEINRLKETLRSYEKTNENLGRFNEKYRWLNELAKKQEAEIDNWVKVARCERGDLNLTVPLGSAPNVILCIFVTNKSVLDLSLSDQLGGVIKFGDLELEGSKKVINSVTDLLSGETRCLTIKQRLSPSDFNVISDAQFAIRPLYFNFDQLEVTIIGGEPCPDVKTKPLILKSGSALAFPLDLAKQGQRIRALSEVRGSAILLHDLIELSNDALPPGTIERWKAQSTTALQQAFQTEGASRIWEEITRGTPIPDTPARQGSWLNTCIVALGALLVDLTGEYVNRNTLNS